jgi:hypothetical protein
VKQLSGDKILSSTSLKVRGYFNGIFSDNLSEHFSEYLMHILTKKSGKICINFENIILGGLRRHLQYKFHIKTKWNRCLKHKINLLKGL